MKSKILAVLSGLAIVAACSSSSNETPPEDPTGSCSAMASACHPYDKLPGIGHECHELGHTGDDKACAPRKAECLAACPPKEGGTDPHADASTGDASDASSPDATGDATGPDGCPAYCDCLGQTCATQAGYPFPTPADCLTACGKMAAEEKACWPKWCEKAKTSASNKEHLCEHAWGKLGLDECDTL